MLRPCGERDLIGVWDVINDGARAYCGVIPADCWREPYMPIEELQHQIAQGVPRLIVLNSLLWTVGGTFGDGEVW